MNQDPKIAAPEIEVKEVVYTSAKRLLDGGADLGIVASSNSVPDDVKKTLQGMWSYNLPNDLKRMYPKKVRQRFVLLPCGQTKKFITFSRVSMSTTSHLGRTTPIAHHLIVPLEDLANAKLNVSDFVASISGLNCNESLFSFYNEWTGEPKVLEPKLLIKKKKPYLNKDFLESIGLPEELENNLKFIITRAAYNCINYNETKKATVILLPEEYDIKIPGLISEIMRLLPTEIQNLACISSQIWDYNDLFFDPWVIFSFTKSPFSEQIKRRANESAYEIFDVVDFKLSTPVHSSELHEILRNDFETNYKNDNLNSIASYFNLLDRLARFKNQILDFKKSKDIFFINNDIISLLQLLAKLDELSLLHTKNGKDNQFEFYKEKISEWLFKIAIDKMLASKNWKDFFTTWNLPSIPKKMNEFCLDQFDKFSKEIISVVSHADIFDSTKPRYLEIQAIAIKDKELSTYLLNQLDESAKNQNILNEKILDNLATVGYFFLDIAWNKIKFAQETNSDLPPASLFIIYRFVKSKLPENALKKLKPKKTIEVDANSVSTPKEVKNKPTTLDQPLPGIDFKEKKTSKEDEEFLTFLGLM